jgi:hypothetical protein
MSFARTVTSFCGVVGLMLIGLSIMLIFTVRELKTTYIRVSETVPTSVIQPVYPAAQFGSHIRPYNPTNNNSFTAVFSQDTIDAIVSPISSVNQATPTPSTGPPPIPANMVNPKLTFARPLQVAPSAFGYCIVTADEKQILTSMEDAENAFGEFVSSSVDQIYKFYKEAYQPTNFRNRIQMTDTDVKAAPDTIMINQFASGVGCVGNKSMALSDDDLRLYTAYRDPSTGNQGTFPFGQSIGKVQVRFRQPVLRNGSPDWNVSKSFVSDISNPFGSQISGASPSEHFYNSFTQTSSQGDDFGAQIKTTVNARNNRYVVAVSCNQGFISIQGRCICIFEEDPSNSSHEVVGVLVLPETHPFYTFTSSDRNSFGISFDIANDTCLVSFGTYGPNLQRIANFRRDAESGVWEFLNLLEKPQMAAPTLELFGTSIVLNSVGDTALVGSPAAAVNAVTAPVGGHVYIFVRDDRGVWICDGKNLTSVVSDPFINAVSPLVSNTGTFGWFVCADRKFTVFSASANQKSLYTSSQPVLPTDATDCSALVVFAFDQKTHTVSDVKAAPLRLYLSVTGEGTEKSDDFQFFVDPLFGSQVGFFFNTIRILVVGSPLNQSVCLYEIAEKT